MRVRKIDIAVFTLLNIAIAVLVCVTAIPQSSRVGAAGDIPAITYPVQHEKLRKATHGADECIRSEARLMGTGDESAVFVHEDGGVIYVFGNATVADLDFDSYGGFLCRLDTDCNILGFSYFDGRMTAASVAEGGFAVATVKESSSGQSVCSLALTDTEGNIKHTVRTDGTAKDIKPFDGDRLTVVTAPNTGALKVTEFSYVSGGLEQGRSTRITSAFDIDYFDCYKTGDGYVVSARAKSANKYDAIVLYTLKIGGDAEPHYFGGADSARLTPYSVLPYRNGYMALCSRDGQAYIVTVNNAFDSHRFDALGYDCTAATLIDVSDKYYAYFERASGGITYEINGNTLSRRTVVAVGERKAVAAFYCGEAAIACTRKNTLSLVGASSAKDVTLDIDDAEVYSLSVAGGVIAVVSARGGKSVSAPSGGRDLYVLKIVY